MRLGRPEGRGYFTLVCFYGAVGISYTIKKGNQINDCLSTLNLNKLFLKLPLRPLKMAGIAAGMFL